MKSIFKFAIVFFIILNGLHIKKCSTKISLSRRLLTLTLLLLLVCLSISCFFWNWIFSLKIWRYHAQLITDIPIEHMLHIKTSFIVQVNKTCNAFFYFETGTKELKEELKLFTLYCLHRNTLQQRTVSSYFKLSKNVKHAPQNKLHCYPKFIGSKFVYISCSSVYKVFIFTPP